MIRVGRAGSGGVWWRQRRGWRKLIGVCVCGCVHVCVCVGGWVYGVSLFLRSKHYLEAPTSLELLHFFL